MKYRLLHTKDFDRGPIARALATDQVETVVVERPSDLSVDSGPTVLVLDPNSRDAFARDVAGFVERGGSLVLLGDSAEQDVPQEIPEHLVTAYVPSNHSIRQLLIALRSGFRDAAGRLEATRLRREAEQRTDEVSELTRIGMLLNTERDYDALLERILYQARRITGADAGSLYLIEEPRPDDVNFVTDDGKPGTRRLVFKLPQNHSRPDIPFSEFTIPIDHSSIAGYVASTGEPLTIDDAYFLPPDVEYTFNRSIDATYNYRTKSILTIPMIDHNDDVIGVLQLINRKRDFDARLDSQDDFDRQVIPFSQRTVDLVSSLAGQAAVSIDNRRLINGIEELFEAFVKAAVHAIEQRDLPTRGHSGRVADMTVALAETVDGVSTGPYADLTFTRDQIKEIRYAGLLHDFGKVGVRERVLGKAKKLYDDDLDLVRQRYAFIRRTAERDFYQRQADYLAKHGRTGFEPFFAKLQATHEAHLAELEQFWRLVHRSNEPTVLPEGNFDALLRYGQEYYEDLDGAEHPFLTEREIQFLTIRKGSLDESERQQIQDHVEHTYQFLKRIKWTTELQNIPDIAWGHHEKLNGTGYPRRLEGTDILPQTRMMTIADIYDALAAQDRPYKDKLSPERAIDILSAEVKQGMLDRDLFTIFTGAKIYEVIAAAQ
jgi:HD-GYP domain-containing protein (c-di-GMP phosphodiesterase class II)